MFNSADWSRETEEIEAKTPQREIFHYCKYKEKLTIQKHPPL